MGTYGMVAACTYNVAQGIVVRTNSPMVLKSRKVLAELMLAQCPNAEVIQNLARRLGVKEPRFSARNELCVVCELCIRYCQEVTGANAISFVRVGSGSESYIIPEISSKACTGCKGCVSICPTGLIKFGNLEGKDVAYTMLPVLNGPPYL